MQKVNAMVLQQRRETIEIKSKNMKMKNFNLHSSNMYTKKIYFLAWEVGNESWFVLLGISWWSYPEGKTRVDKLNLQVAKVHIEINYCGNYHYLTQNFKPRISRYLNYSDFYVSWLSMVLFEVTKENSEGHKVKSKAT